jgi:enoyl-CoA hydratase/carnithine racemase
MEAQSKRTEDTMSTHIRSEYIDRTLVLTLDRADRLNALTGDMYSALVDALIRATSDARVRAVLVRGEGPTFCAGNDLEDFVGGDPLSEDTPVVRFLHQLRTFPKPLLAAVHGHAVGVGTTMLLHCDYVVAEEGSAFQMPFTRLGLVPEAGSSLLVPALVGHRKAIEWLLLGERFGADEALSAGIINKVVAKGQGNDTALGVAARFAALAPGAVRATKRLMQEALGDRLATVMASELDTFRNRLAGPEVGEAVAAFFAKRPADFSRFE